MKKCCPSNTLKMSNSNRNDDEEEARNATVPQSPVERGWTEADEQRLRYESALSAARFFVPRLIKEIPHLPGQLRWRTWEPPTHPFTVEDFVNDFYDYLGWKDTVFKQLEQGQKMSQGQLLGDDDSLVRIYRRARALARQWDEEENARLTEIQLARKKYFNEQFPSK